jgi:iron complex outermembrane receptor protein
LFMEVPTVVTPIRRPQPLTQAPAAVTVITAEEIRQSGATSIPELLRFVPGLDVFQRTASEASVAARGLNVSIPARMQVLLDGLSVYEDATGLIFWHQLPIPLEEIERIEIVRSPATALYGDRAFAGIIHILTKSPESLRGTQLSATAGEDNTWIGTLMHANVAGNLSYKVSASYDRTNRFPNTPFQRSSDALGRLDKRGHFQVNYSLGEGSRMSLAAGIDEFDRRELGPTGPTSPFLLAGGLGFVRANYVAGDFTAQLSYNRFDTELRCPCFFEDLPALAQVAQAQLQHSLTLGHGHVLTGGLTYRLVDGNAPGVIGGHRSQHQPAFFVQDEWRLRDSLALTLGVGVDIHPEAGVSASPRASLVYSPWRNHTFRVSIGRAVRSPSFLENFLLLRYAAPPLPPPLFPPTLIDLGNRDLKPEEMLSYEVGYQALLFERIWGRIDLFYHRIDHLISFVSVVPPAFLGLPPGAVGRQFMNVGDGEIFGGEIGVDVAITSWLKGFVNYSYQQLKDDLVAIGVAPPHKMNAGVRVSLPRGVSATLLVHHVGGSEQGDPSSVAKLDAYTLVNARVGYRFQLFGQDMELSLQAFNLLNDVHREIIAGDLIERRVSGTVRFGF